MRCKHCGGLMVRDYEGDMACMMCGRPAVKVVPLPLIINVRGRGRSLKRPVMRKCAECGAPEVSAQSKSGLCILCGDKMRHEMAAAAQALRGKA